MADTGIVRNRAKVDAVVANARALVAMHDSGETLVDLLFSFAPAEGSAERPAGRFTSLAEVPSATPSSTAMAKALRARGFRFVGPVVAYALMQSAGVVDDHLAGCWVGG
jgi:DNA-3-methyladenine glycosylase I